MPLPGRLRNWPQSMVLGLLISKWFNTAPITLLTKVHIVKAVGFAVGMYGCESWTIEKAEH